MADSIDVLDELNEKKKDLDKMEHDKEVLTKYSALLGIPQHDHGNFKSTKQLYEKKFEVWDKMNKWEERTFEWSNSVCARHPLARTSTHARTHASTRARTHARARTHTHGRTDAHFYKTPAVHRSGLRLPPKTWIWRSKRA